MTHEEFKAVQDAAWRESYVSFVEGMKPIIEHMYWRLHDSVDYMWLGAEGAD